MDKKELVVDMTQKYLNDCEKDSDLRLKKSAFTRKRKLTPRRMLLLLLHRLVCSLQLGLDGLFDHFEKETVSKQAFSKARANLNPAFVRKFADGIAEIYAQDPDVPSWNGMRLVRVFITTLPETRMNQGFWATGKHISPIKYYLMGALV